MKTQLVCDLGSVHCVLQGYQQCSVTYVQSTYWQILFVGKDQKESISQLILVQHALQLLSSLNNTVTIVGINNEDDTLGVLEVMSPERSDFILSTDIPHGELDVLVLDSLDVETLMTKVSFCDSPRTRRIVAISYR